MRVLTLWVLMIPVACMVLEVAAAQTPVAGGKKGNSGDPAPNSVVIRGKATYRSIREAARQASDGDVVEIGPGTYTGDVAVWPQNRLTIRGVGAMPVIDAAGQSAQGKGIFVIQGSDVLIENLAFKNAKVAGLNGAGIRMEGRSLVVRSSLFENNEEGILTWSDPQASLEIQDSQFVGNAFDYSHGFSHAIYVGRIAKFVLTGSYLTRTQTGHLVKSRARETRLLYNRITDEAFGSASYEVDLPDGGIALLMGNLIEQSADTSNPTIVSYGEESMSTWNSNQISLSHNTIINRTRWRCTWLRAASSATVAAYNNLVPARCAASTPGSALMEGTGVVGDADFVDAAHYDFRLKPGSPAFDARKSLPAGEGESLMPTRQYAHPASSIPLTRPPASPGAFQSADR